MMTNQELAQAIEVADQRVKISSASHPGYEMHLAHLEALLIQQQLRAAERATEPMGPSTPTWVPMTPILPFIVTCATP